jgi:hypothetical protein
MEEREKEEEKKLVLEGAEEIKEETKRNKTVGVAESRQVEKRRGKESSVDHRHSEI